MTATSPYASMTPPIGQTPGQTPGRTPSAISEDPEFNEKMNIVQAAIEREENKDTIFNPDIEAAAPPERPFLLLHAGVIGFAMTLVVFVEMLCASRLITEYQWDGGVLRFALVAVIPFFVSFSLVSHVEPLCTWRKPQVQRKMPIIYRKSLICLSSVFHGCHCGESIPIIWTLDICSKELSILFGQAAQERSLPRPRAATHHHSDASIQRRIKRV